MPTNLYIPNAQKFNLSRAGDSLISWQAPDDNTYQLNIASPTPGQWRTVNDSGGRPVMAFRTNSGQDGELVVSLDGAISIAATLLRNEDDFPRKYYFATDGGNNNPLGRPAFILRSEGVAGSPIFPWGSFQVLCIGG